MLKLNFLTKIIWWSKSSHFNVLLIIRPALENGSCALGTEEGKVTLLCLNLLSLWKMLSPEYPLSQDTSHPFSSAMGEMTISVNFLYVNKRNWRIKKKSTSMANLISLYECGIVWMRTDSSHAEHKRNRTEFSNSYVTNTHHAVKMYASMYFKNMFWVDGEPYKWRREDFHHKQ